MEHQRTVVSEITDEELRSLSEAIQKRHGIDFTCYEPKSLKRRILRALSTFKFNSVHELWVKILKEPAFIYPFLDEISVGLTSMFRDPVLWIRLKQMLTQELRVRERLSIWHAGCSTGEEVYTMGIVLRESGFPGKVSAWATDISKQAMEVSKKGEYATMKVTEYEDNYRKYQPLGSLSSYFSSSEEGNILMDNSLIAHVTFDYHNLITDSFPTGFDIIFCRNVMIYFDVNTKRKLFEKFHASLNPDGLLIFGFYDAVFPLMDGEKFRLLDMDSKIFQRV
ncbi:MAG TPA: CheR family methyltransferase [Cyclobacteriaceae bacterium]|jgi:chemotaxis protein methyltransferase CheR|nr:CheR family methyltransferase [Cyclobacteriaceae bacterium]